jgi:hypothetical protein
MTCTGWLGLPEHLGPCYNPPHWRLYRDGLATPIRLCDVCRERVADRLDSGSFHFEYEGGPDHYSPFAPGEEK